MGIIMIKTNKHFFLKFFNKAPLSPPRLLFLGFFSIIIIGTLLLLLPCSTASNQSTDFLTALFTATSAVCVTGLVVVDTGTHWSFMGQIIIAFLIQIGGLGFMTIATFFFMLMGKKIGLKNRLVLQQSFNHSSLQGIVKLSKYVVLITLSLEGIFALVLTLRWSMEMNFGQALWFGIFHAISAFNNAGLDLFGAFRSLTDYVGDPFVVLSITFLIIAGGIGFSVLMDISQYRERKRLLTHTKIVLFTSFILLLSGTLFILLFEWNHALRGLPVTTKILASYFQSVTCRTAGMNTIDLNHLFGYTHLLLIFFMFIGASSGSTGGGIKTNTFALLLLSVWSLLRGKQHIRVFERTLTHAQVMKALAVLLLSMGLVMISSLALMIVEQEENFLLVLFETVSAFATVGLSLGLTTELTPWGKIIIILTMFIGRIGSITAVFAFVQQSKKQEKIKYPEDKILIG